MPLPSIAIAPQCSVPHLAAPLHSLSMLAASHHYIEASKQVVSVLHYGQLTASPRKIQYLVPAIVVSTSLGETLAEAVDVSPSTSSGP